MHTRPGASSLIEPLLCPGRYVFRVGFTSVPVGPMAFINPGLTPFAVLPIHRRPRSIDVPGSFAVSAFFPVEVLH
jgi:hypothetical protein